MGVSRVTIAPRDAEWSRQQSQPGVAGLQDGSPTCLGSQKGAPGPAKPRSLPGALEPLHPAFPAGSQTPDVEGQGSSGKKWKFLKARPRSGVVMLLSFLMGQVSCRPSWAQGEGTRSPLSMGGMSGRSWPSVICHKRCCGLPGMPSGPCCCCC